MDSIDDFSFCMMTSDFGDLAPDPTQVTVKPVDRKSLVLLEAPKAIPAIIHNRHTSPTTSGGGRLMDVECQSHAEFASVDDILDATNSGPGLGLPLRGRNVDQTKKRDQHPLHGGLDL
jgi:hypothetical protein